MKKLLQALAFTASLAVGGVNLQAQSTTPAPATPPEHHHHHRHHHHHHHHHHGGDKAASPAPATSPS